MAYFIISTSDSTEMLLNNASCWLSKLILVVESQSFSSKSIECQEISCDAVVRKDFVIGTRTSANKEARYRWCPSQINPLSIFISANLIPISFFCKAGEWLVKRPSFGMGGNQCDDD